MAGDALRARRKRQGMVYRSSGFLFLFSSSFSIHRSSFSLFIVQHLTKMEIYFRITSYALVATAFLALALTGQLDAVSVVLYAAAVCISFVRDRRATVINDQSVEALPRPRWRTWAWRGLGLLYVPFLFFDA